MRKSNLHRQLFRIKYKNLKSLVELYFWKAYHKISYWEKLKGLLSSFDRLAYSIRLLDVEFLLKFLGVLGSGKIIYDMLGKISLTTKNCFSLIVLIVFMVIFLIVLFAMIKQIKSLSGNVVELGKADSPQLIYGDDLLTEKYIDNGYQVLQEEATEKHYVMSDSVNRTLYEDRWHRYIPYNDTFFLPEQCVYIAPYHLKKIYRKRKSQGTHLYISNLIGLLDDITAVEKDMEVRITKTNYFDFILTNETVSNSYLPVTDCKREVIEGRELLYNLNGTLRNFSDTLCADVLGGSTLAVTRDGYVIMQIQSSHADRSPGTIVPSGSGSTDYADYKELQAKMKGYPFCKLEGPTFQQLIIDTINRELFEENGFDKSLRYSEGELVTTKVIGFARVLDRGAKPDFFGVTYLKAKAIELFPQMNASLGRITQVLQPHKRTDREILRHIIIPYKENEPVTDAVRRAIQEVLKPLNHYNTSFQTGMLLDLIDNYYHSGIDLFGELKKERRLSENRSLCEPLDGEDGLGFSEEGGFAFVIDGATDLTGVSPFTARELAQEIKIELSKRLSYIDKDIQTILLESLLAIKRRNFSAWSAVRDFTETSEKQGPSAAIAIIRINRDKIEYYSLGDCLLSIKFKDGSVNLFTNNEISQLDNNILSYMQQLAEPHKAGSVQKASILTGITKEKLANRNLKNQERGYPILDLSGVGIPRGTYRTFNPDIIESLVLMTDGIADLYKIQQCEINQLSSSISDKKLSNEGIHDLLINDPELAVKILKEEYKDDADWNKYPRFKEIDDIGIIGISLD